MRVPSASATRSAGLRIGVLAAQAGVSPDTLRFYERQGLLPPPQRSAAGYRLYQAQALDRVAFIKRAQALGLTLSEVREILRVADRGTPPCEHVRQILARRLAEVDARIGELEALRATLRQALARSRRLPLARSCICEIIEADPSQ
jgi:DNA-binding transcriptional MerR regulator